MNVGIRIDRPDGVGAAVALTAVAVYLAAGLLALGAFSALCIAAVIFSGRDSSKRSRILLFFAAFTLPLSVNIAAEGGTVFGVPGEVLTGAAALCCGIFFLSSGRMGSVIVGAPLPALLTVAFLPPLFFSTRGEASLKAVVIQAAYIAAFFYLPLYLRISGRSLRGIFAVYAAAAVPAFLWALWVYSGYDFNPVTVPGIFRPFFNDHTVFGAVSALLAAFFFIWGLMSGSAKGVLAGIFFIALTVFSGSRAAIISLAVIPAAGLFAYAKFWRAALPALAALLAVLALLWPGSPLTPSGNSAAEPVAVGDHPLRRLQSASNVHSDVSNIERLNRWHAALAMFAERPHTGFGPGTYQFAYIPYQSPAYENRLTVTNPERPPEGSGGTAHSELLLLLSESGWPAAAVFVLFLLRFTLIFFRKARRDTPLLTAACAGLFTYFIHMQFNNFLTTDKFAFLFWGMAAAAEAEYRRLT